LSIVWQKVILYDTKKTLEKQLSQT